MSQRIIDPENTALNRRHVLKGLATTGIVATAAGCLGDDDDVDDGDDTAPADDADPADDGDDEPDEISFPLEVQLETNADNSDRVEMCEVIAETLDETGYFDASVELYEWNDYVARVLDPEYGARGHVPLIGLSGTFNPESFCNALHHSDNVGQCCNLSGVNDPELDDMMDSARFGTDVAADPDLRRERYDEVWDHLAEHRYSSISHFGLNSAVSGPRVHGFAAHPFSESTFSYALHAPADEQLVWLDDSADPSETDWSDYEEGGILLVGEAENPASFDPAYSTDTTSTSAQGPIFEGLTTTDLEGTVRPWLAESYEIGETQDVDRTDYEDYMESIPHNEEGVPDTDQQVLITHPEDDPVGDDEARVLLPDGAADAVDDGVFGMVITYNLREGVMFHNGEEMTAENVVKTAEYYYNSDVSAQTFDSVLHVREVDEYTVEIYGQVADAEGERELPFLVFSVENIEDADPAEGEFIDPRNDITPYGTGPYQLEEFEDEQYAEYVKFDDYWLEDAGLDALEWWDGPDGFPAGPVLDEVHYEFIPDDATRSGALQSEEIDVTHGLATDTLADFEASDDFQLHTVEAGGYTYLQTPLQVEPWDDERMRKAFNHAVNREFIVENIFNEFGSEAWIDLPELAQGLGTMDVDALEERIRPTNEYDLEETIALVEETIADRGYESNV